LKTAALSRPERLIFQPSKVIAASFRAMDDSGLTLEQIANIKMRTNHEYHSYQQEFSDEALD